MKSGDYVQFQSTGQTFTLKVDKEQECNVKEITVPPYGGGLSSDLICTAKESNLTVTVSVVGYNSPVYTFTVTPPTAYSTAAHSLYVDKHSHVTVTSSLIVLRQGLQENCRLFDATAGIRSNGYNVTNDSTCNLTEGSDVHGDAILPVEDWLSELQDNNQIDFNNRRVSGYTYSHALLPDSPAVDLAPPEVCGIAAPHTITPSSPNLTIQAGDIVQWTDTAPRTVSLNDGEYNIVLVPVPASGASSEVKFDKPGTYDYLVYSEGKQQVGSGTITVLPSPQMTDQRGVPAPQRAGPTLTDGSGGTYRCDSGAYEFQSWVVGQPMPRPPSAIGTQPPAWNVGGAENTSETNSYHAWSSATALDYVLRPSPDDGNQAVLPGEIVKVTWKTDPDPASTAAVAQVGLIDWPNNPQIHVSGARVSVSHDKVNDGFSASTAARSKAGPPPTIRQAKSSATASSRAPS